MAAPDDHKFIFLTHIYAGARVKHEETGEIENLWQERYSERYFELLERYGDKLILEVAGHDHWEDLRLYAPRATGQAAATDGAETTAAP